jgi:hypothetical protein
MQFEVAGDVASEKVEGTDLGNLKLVETSIIEEQEVHPNAHSNLKSFFDAYVLPDKQNFWHEQK